MLAVYFFKGALRDVNSLPCIASISKAVESDLRIFQTGVRVNVVLPWCS